MSKTIINFFLDKLGEDMIRNLIKLAEHLDKKGLYKEADYVDWIIKSSSAKINLSAKEQLKEHLVSKMGIGKDIVMPRKRKSAIESTKAKITISAIEKNIRGERYTVCEIKSSDKNIYNGLYSILIANLFNDNETKALIKECFGLGRVGDFIVDDDNMRYYYLASMSNV